MNRSQAIFGLNISYLWFKMSIGMYIVFKKVGLLLLYRAKLIEKKRVEQTRMASVKIQSYWRMKLQRRDYTLLLNNVAFIQTRYRYDRVWFYLFFL
jgi:hypothetical protein